MSGNAAMSTDERELLANYVQQQHDGFRGAVLDLTDEQAGQRIASSALSVGGLVKHAAQVQVGWRLMTGTRWSWRSADTVDAVLAAFDAEAERVLAAIRAADLDTPVPVPQDVPWFPKDVTHWSVRWVVLHLVEELARHAGHADLLREAIDGATMYELMARREGWDTTAWA